jgi:small subunit ribosomal protein S5
MLACGNYNGVVGFAKAKGPAVPVALQKVLKNILLGLSRYP